MENRLTQEQIQAAASVGYSAWVDGKRNWNCIPEIMAPHLQFEREPIAPPTDEELTEIHLHFAKAKPRQFTYNEFVREFVRRRNSPPDPLREKIKAVLRANVDAHTEAVLLDSIIAAVKEGK